MTTPGGISGNIGITVTMVGGTPPGAPPTAPPGTPPRAAGAPRGAPGAPFPPTPPYLRKQDVLLTPGQRKEFRELGARETERKTLEAYLKLLTKETSGLKKASEGFFKFMRGPLGILGLLFTLQGILKQSSIVSTFAGTSMSILGAILDTALIPYIPFLVKLIEIEAKTIDVIKAISKLDLDFKLAPQLIIEGMIEFARMTKEGSEKISEKIKGIGPDFMEGFEAIGELPTNPKKFFQNLLSDITFGAIKPYKEKSRPIGWGIRPEDVFEGNQEMLSEYLRAQPLAPYHIPIKTGERITLNDLMYMFKSNVGRGTTTINQNINISSPVGLPVEDLRRQIREDTSNYFIDEFGQWWGVP